MSQQPIPTPSTLDLDNIQGDVLSGLPKKTQTYFFFQITDVKLFRSQLTQFVPLVKTTAQVLKDRKTIEDHKKKGDKTLIPMSSVNIAFSHKGFAQMGVDDSTLDDTDFQNGQRADAFNLRDNGTGGQNDFVPDWDPAFMQDIHALIFVSGDSHKSVNKKMQQVKDIFGVGSTKTSIKEVKTIVGDVRPGKEAGHEHFGFLDGISNPSVIGFDKNPQPGPKQIQSGALILGHEGDPNLSSRAPWVVDGSFLAFRYLFQNVLEFDNFLRDNPVPLAGLTPEEGSELLGARLVGRWKSGTPIDLAPFKDDPEISKNPHENNDFRFTAEGQFQKICPFAAHVRKTNPRADLEDPPISASLQKRRITRRGVQFGPEVTKEERKAGKTIEGRGLLFACYQTSIEDGFAFLQKSWANEPTFPPGAAPKIPGLDPLIGQGDRKLIGTDPNNPDVELPMPEFVVSRGGEYFFSPSLKGLRETIAMAA
ncbi:hypothetical protein BDZ94DRAFT_1280704 [Collybia nuda]|uniref:DyP dimeric alpha+beta barrel domain-containing protein n=1 Tax=Collybia nuda TaxID=64659 RepID=A0A9P5YDP4_9AGAR|nr:hypothetical protein BDZ94DRAFT_1280704 [Collybia nuda]